MAILRGEREEKIRQGNQAGDGLFQGLIIAAASVSCKKNRKFLCPLVRFCKRLQIGCKTK
jgi:hypothetical protein